MSQLPNTERPLRAFLCHSSGDKKTVRRLYDRLYDDGVLPWLDEKNLLPGQDWELEIRNAVRRSDVVIVCLSATSVTRAGFVQREIGFALDAADEQPEGAIFLIPLRLEKCDVPHRLRRWQWVDLFEDPGYNQLLRALHTRANEVEAIVRPGFLGRPIAPQLTETEEAASEVQRRSIAEQALLLLPTATSNQAARRDLIALYRNNASDYDLFESTIASWSDNLIAALAEEAPDDLVAIIAALDVHLPRNFPFVYLDTLARLLGRVYQIIRDRAVRGAALGSLLRIGLRYDENDMGKELVTIVTRAHAQRALEPIAQALKENWSAAIWAKKYFQRAGIVPKVFEALADLGIFFVDMGDLESESHVELQGWDMIEESQTTSPSPSGDRTLRYQALRTDNSLTFSEVPNGDYLLTAEIGDDACDDSFQIVIGGDVLYTHRHTDDRTLWFGPHIVKIPTALIEDGRLVVTFRNLATDDCGHAGVYNVKLERIEHS